MSKRNLFVSFVYCLSAIIIGTTTSSVLAGNLVRNGDFSSILNSDLSPTKVYALMGPKNGSPVRAEHWDTTYNGHSGGISWIITSNPNGLETPLHNTTDAPNGSNYVSLDGAFNFTSMYQTITGLTAGNQYQLDFDYSYGQQNGDYGNYYSGYRVSLGDDYRYNQRQFMTSTSFSPWYHETLVYTATAASHILNITAVGNPNIPPMTQFTNSRLNDITPPPVPEPSTLGLLGAAAVFSGVVSLRRRAFLSSLAS